MCKGKERMYIQARRVDKTWLLDDVTDPKVQVGNATSHKDTDDAESLDDEQPHAHQGNASMEASRIRTRKKKKKKQKKKERISIHSTEQLKKTGGKKGEHGRKETRGERKANKTTKSRKQKKKKKKKKARSGFPQSEGARDFRTRNFVRRHGRNDWAKSDRGRIPVASNFGFWFFLFLSIFRFEPLLIQNWSTCFFLMIGKMRFSETTQSMKASSLLSCLSVALHVQY